MRVSPITVGLIYSGIGILFIFLAIQNVILFDWNLFTYLLIALSASDFFIAFRFFYMYLQHKNK